MAHAKIILSRGKRNQFELAVRGLQVNGKSKPRDEVSRILSKW